MADSSSTAALNRALDKIPKLKKQEDFREFWAKLRQATNLYAPSLHGVLDGIACPTADQDKIDGWKKANNELYSILFFNTEGSANTTVRAHESKTAGEAGDGQGAFKALKARFHGNTNEARRSCREKLFSKTMKPGSDPADFFASMEEDRIRLQELGETILDDTFADVLLRALPREYEFVKQLKYRDRSFGLDDIQTTSVNYYIDDLSRKSSAPSIAGRGAAMAASLRDVQCYNCQEYGHYSGDCPKPSQKKHPAKGKKKGRKKGGGGSSQKWCSLHKTTSHSDAECHKQKEQKEKELEKLAANLALLNTRSSDNRYPAIGSAYVAHGGPEPAAEPVKFGFSFCAIGTSQGEANASSATPGSAPTASTVDPGTFGTSEFDFGTDATGEQRKTGGLPDAAFGAFMALDDRHAAEKSRKSGGLPDAAFGAFMALDNPAALKAGIFSGSDSTLTMLLDSGSTDNFVDPKLTPGLRDSVRDYRPLDVPHQVQGVGDHVVLGVATCVVVGTVLDDRGEKRQVSFPAVVVPGLGSNLFSVCTAMQKGLAVVFHPAKPRLENMDGTLILPMDMVGVDEATRKILCTFDVELGGSSGHGSSGLALRAESAEIWHRRMGHINRRSMDVLRKQPDNGVDYVGEIQGCPPCVVGKSEQQAHPKQATYEAKHPFQLMTVDTMGPFTPIALGGYQYVVKYVDYITKWKEFYLMKSKTQIVESVTLISKQVVTPTGNRIEVLTGDQGTEYTSAAFREACRDLGIKLQFASPNTPQQIGANERAGKTIVGMVRCLLADSGLPKFLWGELMLTAVYLSNRAPHAALKNETPYKRLYGKDAHLGHLKVIGARAFVHVETYTKKLEPKAWEGRVVGYSSDSKSWRVYNPTSQSVRESRNVVFIETPSAMLPAPNLDKGMEEGDFTYDDHDDMVLDVWNYTSRLEFSSSPGPNQEIQDPAVQAWVDSIQATNDREADEEQDASETGPAPDDQQSDASPGGDGPVSPGEDSPGSSGGDSPGNAGGGSGSGSASHGGRGSGSASRGGRGGRAGRGGRTSRGGRGGTASGRPTTRSIASAPNAKTLSELRRLANYAKGEKQDIAHKDDFHGFAQHAYAVHQVQPRTPRSHKEAMADPSAALWRAAEQKEMDSLDELQVYDLVRQSSVRPGVRIYYPQWIFKIKANGTRKARVVVCGTNQVPGRDNGSTFSPVCRPLSVRMTLAIAADKNWEAIHLDVVTAFLYADIEEDVYVHMPPGFVQKDEDGVPLLMKLRKSLYGLGQSSRNWFVTIDPELIALGFTPLKSDTCVYIYRKKDVIIILTLYVDDLLIVGADIEVIGTIKRKLMQRFKMTDMGDVSLVLGMQVTRDRANCTLSISQEDYTRSILQKFGMADCKPVSTPGAGPELSTNQPESSLLNDEEKEKYQAITGSVMYLAQITRYDIIYSTCQLARAMSKPSKAHMGAAKHLLRYLAGTADFSIVYKKGGFKLTAFSDSNWGNNPDNGKSTSCYIMMFCKAPVSFKSGVQSLTAMSTMEAELVAAALAMKEAVFCGNMLTELGFAKDVENVPLNIDNTATLHVIGNRAYSSRTKHIALRFFYIRELVTEGKISIHHIPTEDQLADIGTKHLNKHRLQQLLEKIRNF